MPEPTIEFAAQLYDEYQQAIKELDNEKDNDALADIYDKQCRYDTLVRELAIKSEIVDIIPSFAEKKKSRTFQLVAWHIVMLSRELDVLDKMLKFYDQDWRPGEALHLLSKYEASMIVQYLAEKKERPYLEIAGKYVVYNRLSQHLNLFIEGGEFIDLSFYTPDVSLVPDEQVFSALKLHISQKKCAKDTYCGDLLRQKQATGLEYAREHIDSKSNFLAWYGDKDDLQVYLNFIEQQPLEKRHLFLDDVLAYGDLNVTKWLYQQLSSSSVEMRIAAFKKMSEMFSQEIYQDKEFADIVEVYEYVDEFDEDKRDSPLLSTTHMQQLWYNIQGKLIKIRDFDKRYGGVVDICEQFDLLKSFRFLRYDFDRAALSSFVSMLVIYTGQYFPFDCYAYMEKQEAQMDVWEQYLEKNRDKFLPGRWVRWGEYVDE